MKRLTAKRPVLYIGRMYKAGETLPANDQKMVTAWLGAGSAEWTGEQSAAPEQAAEVTGGAQDAQDGANGAGDAPQNGQGENGAQDGQGENGAQDGQKTAQEDVYKRQTQAWDLRSGPCRPPNPQKQRAPCPLSIGSQRLRIGSKSSAEK